MNTRMIDDYRTTQTGFIIVLFSHDFIDMLPSFIDYLYLDFFSDKTLLDFQLLLVFSTDVIDGTYTS